jgi:hypothetical protein
MKPGLKWFVSALLMGAAVALVLAFSFPIYRGKWLTSSSC